MRTVIWTHRPVRDLRQIETYLADISPELAQAAIDRIILSADRLIEFPGIGAAIGYAGWRRWRAVRTSYLIVYRPTRSAIEIVMVQHDRSDRISA